MNRYRVLLPLTVNTPDGAYGQGEEFWMDYTPEEEADVLAWRGGGMLEISPGTYKVVGELRVFETDPGEEFEAALTIGQQAHLIGLGHIERLDVPPPVEPAEKPASTRAKSKRKEAEA